MKKIFLFLAAIGFSNSALAWTGVPLPLNMFGLVLMVKMFG
ncbi:hypothetical protein ACJJIE_22840 [Microbulbifer sp. TRSA001]